LLQFGVELFALSVAKPLLFVFSDKVALDFLFGGRVEAVHTTKFAIEKFVERYGDSIDSLNRAIILSVVFVPIAILPTAEAVKIPLIDLQVARQDWFRVCPAISYGLQVFTLVALCWFLLMRRGLNVLERQVGHVEHFGDVSNIMLTGVVGSLWMFVSIPRHFPSRLHFLWVVPAGLVFLMVLFSPAVLCGYFVRELFVLRDIGPAIVYSVLMLPSVALAFALIGVSIVAGMRETWDDGK
jgi:hypothetical protein